jgi:hypothetical protein
VVEALKDASFTSDVAEAAETGSRKLSLLVC